MSSLDWLTSNSALQTVSVCVLLTIDAETQPTFLSSAAAASARGFQPPAPSSLLNAILLNAIY